MIKIQGHLLYIQTEWRVSRPGSLEPLNTADRNHSFCDTLHPLNDKHRIPFGFFPATNE